MAAPHSSDRAHAESPVERAPPLCTLSRWSPAEERPALPRLPAAEGRCHRRPSDSKPQPRSDPFHQFQRRPPLVLAERLSRAARKPPSAVDTKEFALGERPQRARREWRAGRRRRLRHGPYNEAPSPTHDPEKARALPSPKSGGETPRYLLRHEGGSACSHPVAMAHAIQAVLRPRRASTSHRPTSGKHVPVPREPQALKGKAELAQWPL